MKTDYPGHEAVASYAAFAEEFGKTWLEHSGAAKVALVGMLAKYQASLTVPEPRKRSEPSA